MTLDKFSEVGKNTCVELPPSPKSWIELDERSKIGPLTQNPIVFGILIEEESQGTTTIGIGFKFKKLEKCQLGVA